MLDAQRIKRTLDYAHLWEYDLTVFGSEGHQYYLAPPIEESALSSWENKYGLFLPCDYRNYLTKVGNGFAGPGYGIKAFNLDIFRPEWKAPCLHAPEYEEEYDKLAKEIEAWYDEEDPDDDPCDGWYKRFNCDGVLNVGTNGCAGLNGIALNGSTKGYYLCLTDELEYYRVGELGEQDKPFEEWMMEWLKEVENACDKLTQHQLDRSKWERQWILEFARYWQEKDILEMTRLVSEIEKRPSVSGKCSGFLYYFSPKNRRNLPGAENMADLRQRMGRIVDQQKCRNLPHISCPGDVLYAVAWTPTLEDFVKHI